MTVTNKTTIPVLNKLAAINPCALSPVDKTILASTGQMSASKTIITNILLIPVHIFYPLPFAYNKTKR
jgi:hypothetical protein